MGKKSSIKRILKWVFGGISIVFVVMLFIIVVHDALTGTTSNITSEYCAKYGFLASPGCW